MNEYPTFKYHVKPFSLGDALLSPASPGVMWASRLWLGENKRLPGTLETSLH